MSFHLQSFISFHLLTDLCPTRANFRKGSVLVMADGHGAFMCQTLCSVNPQIDSILTPLSQLKTQRHRELHSLAQGHTGNNMWGWDSKPEELAPIIMLCSDASLRCVVGFPQFRSPQPIPYRGGQKNLNTIKISLKLRSR